MNVSENYKKIVPAAVIIILVIAGIVYYNKIQTGKPGVKPNESAFIMEKDLNLDPADKKIYEDRLATALEKIKNPPEGSTDEDKYDWNMQAGYQKRFLGKFLEAKAYFVTASELRPTYFTAQVALYDTFINMTDYNSARDRIDKALALVPNNADLWRKKIQLEKEKFNATNEQLEQIYAQALESTGGNVDIVTVYAQFLEEKGDLKGAIEQWKKAITVYPDRKEVYQEEITRLEGLVK